MSPSDAAADESIAAARMTQATWTFVRSRTTSAATGMAPVMGSVSASRPNGTAVARSRPALANRRRVAQT